MGGVLCADREPVQLSSAAAPPGPTDGPAPHFGVKAWRFHSDGGRHFTENEPVDLHSDAGPWLREGSTYLVVMLQRRGEDAGCDPAVLAPVSEQLDEVCTPRGATAAFSLNLDLQRPATAPLRDTVYTLFILFGKRAPGLAKALALKWGLDLEKRLLDSPELAERLLAAGRPAPLRQPACRGVPARDSAELPKILRMLVSKRSDKPVPALGLQLPAAVPREAWSEAAAQDEAIPDDRQEQARREAKMALWRPRCSEVTPHVCVGGAVPATTLDTLLAARVTHVLNAASDLVPSPFPTTFAYLNLRLSDSVSEDISGYFVQGCEFADRVRESGGKVLVHCQEGVSRSCTLAAAELIWREGLTKEQALAAVAERRGVCRPNPGFCIRLQEWESIVVRSAAVVYRVAAPTRVEAGSIPICLPPFRPGKAGEPTSMDPRCAYIAVSGGRGRRTWCWSGSECAAAVAEAARMLAPLCARYADVRSQAAELEAVQVTDAAEGAEDPALLQLLQEIGWDGETRHHPGYDASCAALPRLAETYAQWRGRFESLFSAASERERAVARDRECESPRREEVRLLEAFVAAGEGFEPVDGFGDGFDEDAFDAFLDSADGTHAVFVRYDAAADRCDLTVWFGPRTGVDADDLHAESDKVYRSFRRWASSAGWGAGVEWDRLRVDSVLWGLDEDSEDQFTGRWVLS
eukprot:TRINITY_DN6515_c0_g1_i1.p1 TRINITY_DN6515_c0_g1~~TRINITY_DN6515_c0_g1_i1.p1  ORF type:complete len:692 (+),score=189.07 TRINITY_DN6515_c0_g1_i1:290-2365(+)